MYIGCLEAICGIEAEELRKRRVWGEEGLCTVFVAISGKYVLGMYVIRWRSPNESDPNRISDFAIPSLQ
jgi:hypothetical protein